MIVALVFKPAYTVVKFPLQSGVFILESSLTRHVAAGKRLTAWLEEKGVTPVFIEPGSPWENGFVESFHGKLHDECLNEEIF